MILRGNVHGDGPNVGFVVNLMIYTVCLSLGVSWFARRRKARYPTMDNPSASGLLRL
jgi:hypothetical protein